MVRIGLLSDTHNYLDPQIYTYFEECHEIWHAGDFGDIRVARSLESFKKLRGVYGNIDGQDIRMDFPQDLRFQIESVDVFMTHIGGYPGRYQKRIRDLMNLDPPKLFICGHSHILKVMYDPEYQVLHMNPGACGRVGFHQVRTMIRFSIEGDRIFDAEVIELGKRAG